MAQPSSADDGNLDLAVVQLAGMFVCEQMRGHFRPLTVEDPGGAEVVAGTLWVRDWSARAEGLQLTLALGGMGWRWVNQQQKTVGAGFEVSQFARFAVEVEVTGEVEARYDPAAQVFTLRFAPVNKPQVAFSPLGDVEVETEGLWSEVVSGFASLVMKAPDKLAEQAFQSAGEERFEDRFARGFVAELDFCSGRLRSGFGLAPPDSASATASTTEDTGGGGQERWTQALMHPEGLLLDGPEDARGFAVHIDTPSPLQAQLLCRDSATSLAQAFLEERVAEASQVVAKTTVSGRQRLDLEHASAQCSMVLALRPANGSEVFQFRYRLESTPLIEAERRPAACAR